MSYEFIALKHGFETLEHITKAFRYLMDRDAVHDVDINNFNAIVTDKNGNTSTEHFYMYYSDGELNVTYQNTVVYITPELIVCDNLTYIRDEDYDLETSIFVLKNPNEIVNEETFFQASTLTDLSGIDSYEWFITVMKAYAEVADFFENDNEVDLNEEDL